VSTTPAPQHLLGRGRSAVVLAQRDLLGREVARKVFLPDLASRIVFYVLEGAKNPYAWCEDAVGAALERRALLSRLVPLWFGDRLRLPRTDGARWNEGARAFELVMERIRGRHAPLAGPFPVAGWDALTELTGDIFPRLQRQLREAGFEGLLWQAGYGNPVACANFLLEERPREGRPQRAPSWVWIDLESGVPALFAADPRIEVGFYLRRTLERRRPLFDDVDIARLRRYLGQARTQIEGTLGPGAVEQLLVHVERLEQRQRGWHALDRLERGVRSAWMAGKITREQAQHFLGHPGAWGRHMAAAALRRGASALAQATLRLARAIVGVRWGRLLRGAGRLFTSQRYRSLLGRRFASRRVRAWTERGFLTPAQAVELRRGMSHTETAAYVTDCVMHLMLKPFAKVLQYVVGPLLLLAGVTSAASTVALLVGGGAVVRTLYTLGRFVQATLRRRPRPWVALGVGALPYVGNLAYPLQLVASSVSDHDPLARFLLHDMATTVARGVPIWGGPDTGLEHWASRVAGRLTRRRRGPAPVPLPSSASAAPGPSVIRARTSAKQPEEVR